MSIYNDIKDAASLEAAVTDTVKSFISAYLGEVEVQNGIDRCSIPRPRSYSVASEFNHWPENQLPGIIIITAGTSRQPLMQGDGSYRASYAVGVGAVVSAKDAVSVNALAKRYTAAIRTLLIQQRSMGGYASGLTWLGEEWNRVPTRDKRTLMAGLCLCEIEVKNVSNEHDGPRTPPDDPCVAPGDWGTVLDTQVDIENEEPS